MAYVSPNFKTKKALKDALLEGKRISVFQPNNIFNREFRSGEWVTIEGPHNYHRWYANCLLDENLNVIKVK